MTVIAGFIIPEGAALIGDILASTDFRSAHYIPIPTVEDPRRQLWKQLNYSAGLFRKLIYISPFLCIAWAGGQSGAVRIAEDMRQITGEGPVPKQAFLRYMGLMPSNSAVASMSMIALVVYDTGEIDMLARNARSINKLTDGTTAYCAGGGKFDAADLVACRGALREVGSDEELVLGLAHKLIGTFHGRESAPGGDESGQNPLRGASRYGGGYEVAFVRNGRIVCEGDTTLLFWDGHLSAKGEFELHPPRLIVRRAYIDGQFILRWASVRKAWTGCVDIPYLEQRCVSVPQVDEPPAINPEKVSVIPVADYPRFTSLYEASIVSVTAQGGPKYIVTALQRPVEGHTRNVSFVDGKEATQFYLNRLAVEHGLHYSLYRSLTSDSFERVKGELGVKKPNRKGRRAHVRRSNP